MFNRQNYKTVKEIFYTSPKFIQRQWIKISIFIFLKQASNLLSLIIMLPSIKLLLQVDIIHTNIYLNYIYNVLPIQTEEGFIIFFVISNIACSVILLVVNIIAQVKITTLNSYIRDTLRVCLFQHYLCQNYNFQKENHISHLQHNLNLHTNQSISAVSTYIAKYISIILMVLVLSLVMIKYPLTTLSIITILSTILLSYNLYQKKSIKKNINIATSKPKRLGWLQFEVLNSLLNIQLNHKEKYYLQLFTNLQSKIKINQDRIEYIKINLKPFLEIIIMLLFSSAIVISFTLLAKVNLYETIPKLIIYPILAYRIIPIMQAIWQYNIILKESAKHYQTIKGDIKAAIERSRYNISYLERKYSTVSKVLLKKKIVIQDISYSYPNSKQVINNNISFDIPYQSYNAIIGQSGYGKSTLTRIIAGIITPTKGNIYIDGTRLSYNESDIDIQWHANISYIDQNPVLFNASIAENIAIGIPNSEIQEKKILKILKKLDLISLVKDREKGIWSILEAQGDSISGGQKQRINFARALYSDKPIFILDEPTNSLDHYTEEVLFQVIEKLKRKKTIILITHKVYALHNVDKIIVMNKKGGIEIEGTYKQVSSNPTFKSISQQL